MTEYGLVVSHAPDCVERVASGVVKGSLGVAQHALPPDVLELSPRMREIATIVYLGGGVRLTDVQANIDDRLTIYGIRTLLNRLERRGIVKKRRSGRHSELLYLPGIINDDIRRLALARLIHDNFAGSVGVALQDVLRLSARKPGLSGHETGRIPTKPRAV